MEKLKNKNTFLIACVSCIMLLLTICYFGISTSSTLKGTSAAGTCSGSTPNEIDGYCCPNASDTVETVNGVTYCVNSGYAIKAAGTSGYVCITSVSFSGVSVVPTPNTYCAGKLGAAWIGTSSAACVPTTSATSASQAGTCTCRAPIENCTTVAVSAGKCWQCSSNTDMYEWSSSYPGMGYNGCTGGWISTSLDESSCVTKVEEITCDPGDYYSPSLGKCTSCVKGYYCPGGTYDKNGTTDTGINQCPSGTTSSTGSDSESDCVTVDDNTSDPSDDPSDPSDDPSDPSDDPSDPSDDPSDPSGNAGEVKIRYNASADGNYSSVNVKGTTTQNGQTNTWKIDTNGYINKNNQLELSEINYDESLPSHGLLNYNNGELLYATREGYYVDAGKEWKCISGECNGKVYNQSVAYKASDFCDASDGDCTVILGINWKKSSTNSGNNNNVTTNPPTGQIAIFVVWVIGIAAVVYSFWYFRKAKQN